MDLNYIAEMTDRTMDILAAPSASDALKLAAAQICATLHLADLVSAAVTRLTGISASLETLERARPGPLDIPPEDLVV